MNENFEFRTMQINLYDCKHPLMTNVNEMNEFLDEFVLFIDMNKISEEIMERKNPHSINFSPCYLPESEHGITGNLIMSESHIHAHTFPNKDGFCNIVVTSCKEFDTNLALLWILKYTKASIYKIESIKF